MRVVAQIQKFSHLAILFNLGTFAQSFGMKFLILIGLVYLAYRFFFVRPAMKGPSSFPPRSRPDELSRKPGKPKEGEDYIDYEEVD